MLGYLLARLAAPILALFAGATEKPGKLNKAKKGIHKKSRPPLAKAGTAIRETHPDENFFGVGMGRANKAGCVMPFKKMIARVPFAKRERGRF
jgi:hypothetical protein